MAEPKTRDEVVQISNRVADEVGIPRLLLLGCGIAEGNLKWNARRPTDPSQDERYWPDVSHGVWQQTVRWSEEYRAWYTNDAPGHVPDTFPGADVTEAAGVHYYDVEHAARVASRQLKGKWNGDPSDDGLLRAMYLYNWPGGGGRPYTSDHEANYRRGLSEATAILGTTQPSPAPVIPTYNPDTPPERQVQSWACAIRATTWVLKSLGVNIDAGTLQDEMVPGRVTPELGLLDARGYGIAETIKAHIPTAWHDRVHVFDSISWDELRSLAGQGPIALGGRAWYHWTAVRQANADGTLALANPAPGYKGVGDTLSRGQWDALGPFSAVWVNAAGAAVPEPGPTPPTRAQELIANIERDLAELKALVA
jgi:hypothetical protein